MTPLISEDSVAEILQVHLMNDNSSQAVAGDYLFSDEAITFEPLIPFTRGLSYTVTFRDDLLTTIEIPPASESLMPEVLAVYPTADTLPENLLKTYIVFSRPMSEARPLSFVRLVRNGVDTVSDAFLDLRPALWNRENTMLTLWLDPGRIKRDLQPNQLSGLPLTNGHNYELIILSTWPSENGATLKHTFKKRFFTHERDESSPDVSKWTITSPAEGSSDTLRVELNEPLDYLLLKEAIKISEGQTDPVTGQIITGREERVFYFIPEIPWRKGTYMIQCESRLEDLAGNNLNRLFDQDVTAIEANTNDEPFHQLSFTIK